MHVHPRSQPTSTSTRAHTDSWHACRFAADLAEAVEEAKAAVRMDDEAAFAVLYAVARTELVKMINAARNKGTPLPLPPKSLLPVACAGNHCCIVRCSFQG